MMIAIRCPICGTYMDQTKNEKVMRCPRCWAALWLKNVKHSPWEEENSKKKARLTGLNDDIRVGAVYNPDLHSSGSRSGRKKRNKPKQLRKELWQI